MRMHALAIAAIAGIFFAPTTADARRHWTAEIEGTVEPSESNIRIGRRDARRNVSDRVSYRGRTVRSRRASRDSDDGVSFASLTGGSGLGPRPGKWCGWWMRSQLGGGPAYNLAWNWRHYGSSTSAQVGAVVVWRHHVGIITGQASNGQWIVKSGNDGGRVRERARSVSGAIFRI